MTGTTAEPEIRHYRHGDFQVVEAGEDVDVYTAPLLKDAIFGLEAHSWPIAVDLRPTRFIDTTGLAVIFAAAKRAKGRHGAFVVICDREHILKAFRLAHLSNWLDIRESLDEMESPAPPGPSLRT